MFISKKRYEEELEKARMKGFEEATKQFCEEERFRDLHRRIDNLADRIEKPKTIGFTDGGVNKC